MKLRLVHLAGGLLLMAMGGCLAPSEPAWRAWARQQGGLAGGAYQSRLQAVGERWLAAHHGTLRVLQSPAVCAYAWPDGNVFVTRGLMDLLGDGEVAAAVAHEMGHLLDDGRLPMVRTLEGSSDGEARADWIGCRLLRDRRAMLSMLEKVRSAPALKASLREAMDKRIKRLRAYPAEEGF